MTRSQEFQIQTDLEFTVTTDDSTDLRDALMEAIKNNPEFAPHVIIFDQPYAVYQEYGTSPCHSGVGHKRTSGLKRSSKRHPFAGGSTFGHTDAQRRFIEWAKYRANGKDYMTLARTAYHVVMDRGLPKNQTIASEYVGFHPFARPAFYEIAAKASNPGAFSSISEIAEELKDRAIQIMTDNDWVASGQLRDSIICRPLSADEILEKGLMNDDEDKQ